MNLNPKILLIKSNKNYSQVLGIVTLNYFAYNSNSFAIGKVKSNNYNKMLNISSIFLVSDENICLFEKEQNNYCLVFYILIYNLK